MGKNVAVKCIEDTDIVELKKRSRQAPPYVKQQTCSILQSPLLHNGGRGGSLESLVSKHLALNLQRVWRKNNLPSGALGPGVTRD